MLADDDAAVADQLLCRGLLGGDVKPGAGIENVHRNIGADGLDAEEERGVAGDDLCISIGTDVADLDLAVLHVLVGELALFLELVDLQTGNDAGNIAGFIDLRECVVEIRQVGLLRGVAGHGDVGILLSRSLCIVLMAIGVREDERAALVDAVLNCGLAGFVFGNRILPDDVVRFGQAEVLAGFFNAVDVRKGIAFVFVADEHDADFDVLLVAISRGIAAAAGKQTGDHRKCQDHCQDLFHFRSS